MTTLTQRIPQDLSGTSSPTFGTFKTTAASQGGVAYKTRIGQDVYTLGGTGRRNCFVGNAIAYGSAINTDGTDLPGADNTALGTLLMVALSTGRRNVAVGSYALNAVTTGNANIAVGYRPLTAVTQGASNVGIGDGAAMQVTTGNYNTCVGIEAGWGIPAAGANVTCYGYHAGYGFSGAYTTGPGDNSTWIGYLAGGGMDQTRAQTKTTAVGALAGYQGGTDCTFLGYAAGRYQDTLTNVFILDGLDRSTTAGEVANAMLYGILHASAASQTLYLNAVTSVSQKLLVGAQGTPAAEFQVASTSSNDVRGLISSQHIGNTYGARIIMRKSRGTLAAPATVVANEVLGTLIGSGYDGSNYLQTVAIEFITSGTVAATRVPTGIVFKTGTDAAPSVLTEAMRITSEQRVNIGSSSFASPTHKLTVQVNQAPGAGVAAAPAAACFSGTGANNRVFICDAQYTFGVSVSATNKRATFDTYDYGGSAAFFLGLQSNGGCLGLFGALSAGTNATASLVVKTGTAPSGNVTDCFQLYSADQAAGNACPHVRTENGDVVKLYKETTGVAEAAFVENAGGTVVNVDSTFAGYTVQQIVQALQNQGLLT